MVICTKIILKWVSIYETNERDIEIPDIHMFPRVEGLSTGPPGFGVSHHPFTFVSIKTEKSKMLSLKIIIFDNFIYYSSGKYLLGMLYNNIYIFIEMHNLC